LVVKNNNNIASNYTDELTLRKSTLDGAISFKRTYYGESVGLVT